MTAKEKAQELLRDMEARIEQCCNQSSREAHALAAKKCANYAVNGLIAYSDNASDEEFWKQVKEELNKL